MTDIDYTGLDWGRAIIVGTALRDGLIPTVANETLNAKETAQRLNLDERATHIMLSTLAEMGLLDETPEGFRLREEHRGPLLDEEDDKYVGGSVIHRFELITTWTNLPEILKTGLPAEDRTRPNFEGTATFIHEMRRTARPGAEGVADKVLPRLVRGATILDIGGGPGTNAEAFARGGARVTVFDRPEVIDQMRDILTASGIAAAAGDMNESLPEGPFDAVYFGNTSHMYGPEENQTLFARMRETLAPGGLLVVREFVRGMSDDAALFAVNMLIITARGNTYSAPEYEDWLVGAGFEAVEFVPVPGRGTHLIMARNPA
jgi:SAM-dependent methyltransferase